MSPRIENLLLLIAILLSFLIQFVASDASGAPIRICEGCHGFESLHNIQADSPDPDNIGTIVVGGEQAGYGHVGRDAGPGDSDCWGCHGFGLASVASAPGTGPVVPYITNTDISVVTVGTDTAVTLTGKVFINTVMGGATELTSNVELTASDGFTTTLTPDSVTESEIVVTLPGSLIAGNYHLRAVKGLTESNPIVSNPIVISVKPAAVIRDMDCNRKNGVRTITGSGFGDKPEGTDPYINVEVNGASVEILSWTDTQIKASVSSCSNKHTVTVNALFGSATNGDDSGGGKPPKPCKGNRCN
jgi:hypothetical protein